MGLGAVGSHPCRAEAGGLIPRADSVLSCQQPECGPCGPRVWGRVEALAGGQGQVGGPARECSEPTSAVWPGARGWGHPLAHEEVEVQGGRGIARGRAWCPGSRARGCRGPGR